MRSIWQTIERHPRSTYLLLGLWLAIWILTFATWIWEPGRRGMHPVAVVAQLVPPLAAGGIAWWWRRRLIGLNARRLLLPAAIGLALWFLPIGIPMGLRIALSALAVPVVATYAGLRGLGASALAGLLVMEANVVMLFAQGAWLFASGALAPQTQEVDLLFGLLEMVEWGVFLGGLGLIIGWLGGLLVAVIATGLGGNGRRHGSGAAGQGNLV